LRAGDVKTFAAYVDLETIARRSAAEARASWAASIPLVRNDTENGRHFIALARRKIAEAERVPAVSMDELRPWLSNVPIRAVSFGAGRNAQPYIVHRGLDEFEVRDCGASEEFGPLLTFSRRGLGWRLVGVRWGQQ
jgi:hypothetical protein